MKFFSLIALLLGVSQSSDFFYGGDAFDNLHVRGQVNANGQPKVLFGKVNNQEPDVYCVTFIGSYETMNANADQCGHKAVVKNSALKFSNFQIEQISETKFQFLGLIQNAKAEVKIDFDLSKQNANNHAGGEEEVYGLHYSLSMTNYTFTNVGAKYVLRMDANACGSNIKNALNPKVKDLSNPGLASASISSVSIDSTSLVSIDSTSSVSIDSTSSVSIDGTSSVSIDSTSDVSIDSTSSVSVDGVSVDVADNGINVNNQNQYDFKDAMLVNLPIASQKCPDKDGTLRVDICFEEESNELRFIMDNFSQCSIVTNTFIGSNDAVNNNIDGDVRYNAGNTLSILAPLMSISALLFAIY